MSANHICTEPTVPDPTDGQLPTSASSMDLIHLNESFMTPAIGRLQRLGHQLQRNMASQTTVPAAPWRDAFLSQIEQLKQPAFTLSSLHNISTASAPQLVPRARTVIYRGTWASLTPNPKNPAPLNPPAYETDLPTITTDARMHKVTELFPTAEQSSVGGPVEAVFWIPDSMTQWRIRGRVCMIGPDIDAPQGISTRDFLTPYMRRRGDVSSWSWSRELTAQFGNLSPFMRGTFRNPPPGTPISQSPGGGLGLGQTVEDLEDGVARENFRVLVIVPEEVDRVDLTDPERGRRWDYRLEGREWKERELWP
ncbi:Zn(2)Cys(6) transcription factor [Pochonia chlamydosporia 170]|uniref:Zn(2)Cys(6) transcription factor n=1 Tax=Pochonia chlamydosporia 170 TaxID=1380566 RepID=A0A179G0P7_METCM|nr:Zn(2)Cys(6) transcription factor [Pochonia chlamydosporia 170]OAQ71267.1 Zn(2)Cys(6) transcription factor [Pochonia chlamydosporia 170]